VPRHKSAFRVTHRFTRPLNADEDSNGSVWDDLLNNFFGLDGSAIIGLEYRFGLFRKTQVGIHRASSRVIEFFGQRELWAQSDNAPMTVSLLLASGGEQNFHQEYSTTIGLLLSREVGEHAAFYLEPIYVDNSNPAPEDSTDEDNGTFMVGLGTRVRFRPSLYLFVEGAPRVGGYKPGDAQISFGIEKRWGGHLFQANFSNGRSTTFARIARGAPNLDQWFLGFNISRKFF
jgi:hypothetical protein